MRSSIKVALLCLLVALASLPLAAQMIPESSTLVLDERTDVGGTVLEPGTYMIRSMENSRDRSVIQVMNTDGTKVYATVLTVPHHLEAKETRPNTEYVFYQAAGAEPRALRTWYPADPVRKYDAYDIVYEEGRARELARRSKMNVASYGTNTSTSDFNTTTITNVTPVETTTTTTTTMSTTPSVTTETTNTTSMSNDMSTESTTTLTTTELPRTASSTPLIALLGVAALAGAALVRATR